MTDNTTPDVRLCFCEHIFEDHYNDGSDEWPCSVEACYCTDFEEAQR